MNIKAMQKRLRDFAASREWQSFHSPKNLAMALMVELCRAAGAFSVADDRAISYVDPRACRPGKGL